MKIVAIIQARMGSTRLPGKIMRNILGKPVLIHELGRIGKIKALDELVVATTTNKRDDIIVKTVQKYYENISLFRGSEEDVLDRYYKAAIESSANTIVRITSDCPLIDPVVSDKVITAFLKTDCDYCSNTVKRTYPIGLDTEVFKFKTLEKSWNEASKKSEREHVTLHIRNNSEKFKLLNVANNTNLGNLRWTLDTPEDLEFINEIYKRLSYKKKNFLMADVLEVLEVEPILVSINKHIKQKVT